MNAYGIFEQCALALILIACLRPMLRKLMAVVSGLAKGAADQMPANASNCNSNAAGCSACEMACGSRSSSSTAVR